jgi:hypothetical protein
MLTLIDTVALIQMAQYMIQLQAFVNTAVSLFA